MRAITLCGIGPVPGELIAELSRFLHATLQMECAIDRVVLDPAPARDRERGQMNARELLPRLEARATELGTLVLGVTEEDLFSPIFTFVFGEARLGGQAALFSLCRLRPEHYGLLADEKLLGARARREALHETGHLLGLNHCKSPDCAMRFSGAAEEIDLKSDRFC
ncbi:MAG TPA: archemetzincin, partial [Candidatus Eisenbacteria bacterium]|nr:archemetzincin [Candidatus Eisenbacteria bacterium]